MEIDVSLHVSGWVLGEGLISGRVSVFWLRGQESLWELGPGE